MLLVRSIFVSMQMWQRNTGVSYVAKFSLIFIYIFFAKSRPSRHEFVHSYLAFKKRYGTILSFTTSLKTFYSRVGWGSGGLCRVAEPKLFDSAPAPAPTLKKFRLRLPIPLRLRLELCGCLFSQLLNEKAVLRIRDPGSGTFLPPGSGIRDPE